MMRSFAASVLVTLIFSGCHAAGHAPNAPFDAAQHVWDSITPPVSFQAGERLSGLFTVQVDPDAGNASLTADASDRNGASQPPQAQSYDLDISKFVSKTNLRVVRVRKVLHVPYSTDVEVTFRFQHPFRAPDFASGINAANRADLGITGRLLLLMDQNHDSLDVPGEGTYQWDDEFLENPDGFVEVGDLLRQTGLTNNLFPYKLLADEALDNRVDVSNDGDMTGSYSAAMGGWQRANIGPDRTDWTGYDYVHQGQATEIAVVLNGKELRAAAFTFKVALLAKYTDPRGTGSPAFRMPFEPMDVSKFAYRLPYAALDVSECAWCDTLDVNGQPNLTTATLALRDWDTGAAEIAVGMKLSDESNVAKVQPGASAAPVVEMVQPSLFPTPQVMTVAGGTGKPGDELRYVAEITNVGNWEGEDWMLYRATDPESIDPAFSTYHFGVDPNTLAASPSRALKPRTFMPARVRAWKSASWFRYFDSHNYSQSPGPAAQTGAGHLMIGHAMSRPQNDGDTAPCLQSVPKTTYSEPVLTELDAEGRFVQHWDWPSEAYVSQPVGTQDNTGNTYVGFCFAAPDESNGQASTDIDPGPGVDLRSGRNTMLVVEKLGPAGNLLWGHEFGEPVRFFSLGGWGPGGGIRSITVGPNGLIYVLGDFAFSIDLDPGPGTYELTASASTPSFFLSVFDADGNWQWGWGGGGGSGNSMLEPMFRNNGNLIASGNAFGVFDFDPGPGQFFLDTDSGAFRAEYTDTGSLVSAVGWSHVPDLEGGASVSVAGHRSDDGEWYSGTWTGDVDLDPGPGTALYSIELGITRTYVSRFAADGSLAWSTSFEMGDATQASKRIDVAVVDSQDRFVLYTTVPVGNTIDLDPGPGMNLVTGTGTYGESAWFRLSKTGALDWVQHYPNAGGLPPQLFLQEDDELLLVRGLFGAMQVSPTLTLTTFLANPALIHLQSDGSW